MELQHNKWSVGEIAKLKPRSSFVCKSGLISYEHFIFSRYLCIREETNDSRGVLVKVLGKTTREPIFMKGDEPFVKDDKLEGFSGDVYSSYRFPTVTDVEMVLDIIRNNPMLLDKLDQASMHINPNSTFWVRETASKFLFMKELQFYNASTEKVLTQTDDDTAHYRLSLAFFYKSKIYF